MFSVNLNARMDKAGILRQGIVKLTIEKMLVKEKLLENIELLDII